MERRSAHELALRAASRITGLSVLVLGCAPKAKPPTAPEPAPPPVGIADDAKPDERAEIAPPEPEDPVRSCQGELEGAFGEDHALLPERNEQEVAQCCQTIAEAVDVARHTGATQPEWPRSSCCQLLNWRGSIACAPWGPTAPPSAGVERIQSSVPGILDLRAPARAVARTLRVPAPRDPATREAAILTWRERMVNEYVSARVFEAVAAQLAAAGFDAASVRRWAGFAEEERRHGILCGAVVEALGGDALAPRPALPAVPQHPDADLRAAALRNVLSISALSETVAVALIGAERLEMDRSTDLHTLLTQIYADEIGHANAGWRLLCDALSQNRDGALAHDLATYLPTAVRDLIQHELVHLPAAFVAPAQGHRWGLCDGMASRALFADTLHRVIEPALRRLLGQPIELATIVGAEFAVN